MIAYFDTNVLVYAFNRDDRAALALRLIDEGGVVGVQTLNEFSNVALRKLKMGWHEIHDALDTISDLCTISAPIDLLLHESGLAVAQMHRLAVFDAMIVADALRSGCETLWSEDMHDGLVIDGRLTIRNPFISR